MKKAVSIFCLLLVASVAFAQQSSKAIFSAKVAEVVPPDIQGTPLLLSSFQEADVTFNGTLYKGLSVNIDALNDELLLKDPSSSKTLALSRRLTEKVVIGNEKYVNLQAMGLENAPEGLFRVCYEGQNTLLSKTTKSLIVVTDGQTKKMSRVLESKTSFYLLLDGQRLVKVSSNKDVLKAFPLLKKEISAAVNKNHGLEDFAIETLKFVER